MYSHNHLQHYELDPDIQSHRRHSWGFMEIEESTIGWDPMRRLYAGVIVMALADALKLGCSLQNTSMKDAYTDAWNWIFDKEKSALTFEEACDWCNLDAEYVRKKVLDKQRELYGPQE